MVANRLSHVFDWSGPSFAVDTACSSSLVALHEAAMHLRAGEVDAAVVAAANLVLTPAKTRSFTRNGMLSPRGTCRAFDDAADGYVRGEGAGALILKRLSDAERDGDPVLSVIRGTAVNHTGGSAGFLTAPSRPAQEAVLRRALARSGRTAADIGYVEAHGTGTQLGDLIELEALHAVLGEPAGRAPVAVGSVKTNIGHLEPAAGIAGLIKTVLALQAAHIPPSLNYETPNRSFDFDGSPLFVADRLLPWGPGPRVAGVSSFGFGGANAHVVVEAAPGTERGATDSGPQLLVLSAGSDDALRTLARRLVLMLRSAYCPSLEALAEASRLRPAGAHRLACVADSAEQLQDKLQLFLAGVEDVRSLHVGIASTAARPYGLPTGTPADRGELAAAAEAFVSGADLAAGPRRRPGCASDRAARREAPVARTRAAGGARARRPYAQPVDGPPGGGGAPRPRPAHPAGRRLPGQGRRLPRTGPLRPARPHLPGGRRGPRDPHGRARRRRPRLPRRLRRPGVHRHADRARAARADRPAPAHGFTEVGLDAMYAAFARAGLDYGTGFRTVASLSVAPGEALGVLRGDAAGTVDARILDGAFQIALAACGAQGLYVPFTVERLTVLGRLPGTARVYARRDRDSEPDSGLLTASLVVLDGDEPVLEARGITWKRLSAAPSGPAAAGDTGHGHRPVPAALPAAPPLPPRHRRRPRAHRQRAPARRPAEPRAGGGTDRVGGRRPGTGRRRTGGRPPAPGAGTRLDARRLAGPGHPGPPRRRHPGDARPGGRHGRPPRAGAAGRVRRHRAARRRGRPPRWCRRGRAGRPGRTGRRAGARTGSGPGPGADRRARPGPGRSSGPRPGSGSGRGRRRVRGRPRRVRNRPRRPRGGGRRHARHRRHRHRRGVPHAGNTDELWRVLVEGEDCLTEVPASRWDIDAYYGTDGAPGTVYLRRAGFVEGLTDFDPGFFRLSPAEAEWIDPQQRHLVQSAWRALEDAGLAGKAQPATGVFVGASYQHYRDTVVGDVVQTPAGLGNHNAILANRVSFFLDLHGPSMTIDTLCSSSLVALHTAVRSIRAGECEQAVVAGVHLGMSPSTSNSAPASARSPRPTPCGRSTRVRTGSCRVRGW